MSFLDGTGSLGLGLGGVSIGSLLGLTGGSQITTPETGMTGTLTPNEFTIQGLKQAQNNIDSFNFTDNGFEMPTQVGTKFVSSEFSSNPLYKMNVNNPGAQVSSAPVSTGSQSGGLLGGEGLNNILKLGQLGLSAYNDIQNQKARKYILNRDTKKINDSKKRDHNLSNSLKGIRPTSYAYDDKEENF